MKVKEVMGKIEETARLEKNLAKLCLLAEGGIAGCPDEDVVQKISEEIADLSEINMPLKNVLSEAHMLAVMQVRRLHKILDEAEVDVDV